MIKNDVYAGLQTRVFEALHQPVEERIGKLPLLRSVPQYTDNWRAAPLRSRCERPSRCSAKCCNEFSPLHSTTVLARASSDAGTMIPRTFAVFRLIARSNAVGCSTGKSPGLAP